MTETESRPRIGIKGAVAVRYIETEPGAIEEMREHLAGIVDRRLVLAGIPRDRYEARYTEIDSYDQGEPTGVMRVWEYELVDPTPEDAQAVVDAWDRNGGTF